MTTTKPTRPDESDMITKPRADAMTKQVESLQAECERLRDENANLLKRFRYMEAIATDPVFESDAMEWIASECWKARTVECEKCKGHMSDCDKCGGKGRI